MTPLACLCFWYLSSGVFVALLGFLEHWIYLKMGCPSPVTQELLRVYGVVKIAIALIVLWPWVIWKVLFGD